MKPRRICWHRGLGKMPSGAVCIMRPSRFGNPYPLGVGRMSREESVRAFRSGLEWALTLRDLPTWLRASDLGSVAKHYVRMAMNLDLLRGKDLACACPLGLACHGDVLLELSNRRLAVEVTHGNV